MTDSGLPPARRLWERVEQERTARGWTTLELERRSGVDRGTVSRWRAGRRLPLPEKVIALANAFSLPHKELLKLVGYIDSPVESAMRDAIDKSLAAAEADEITRPLRVIGDDETDELLRRLPASRRRLLEQVRKSERERLEREAAEASRRFADLVRSEATQSESGNNG
jgi:transcriptional regulator with XRE-family HTH domain